MNAISPTPVLGYNLIFLRVFMHQIRYRARHGSFFSKFTILVIHSTDIYWPWWTLSSVDRAVNKEYMVLVFMELTSLCFGVSSCLSDHISFASFNYSFLFLSCMASFNLLSQVSFLLLVFSLLWPSLPVYLAFTNW